MRIFTQAQKSRVLRLPLLFLAAIAPACAHQPAPIEDTMVQIEQGRDLLGRQIADMVDRVDRAIGDPRVEDRQVKVKVDVGLGLTFREGRAAKANVRVLGRIPLPALQRRANFFLDLGGALADVGEPLSPAVQELENNYQARLQYLSLTKWPVSYGATLNGYWSGGPQAVLKPFLRWEKRMDTWRLYATEEVSYRTDEQFGERTYAHLDYLLGEKGFIRVLTDAGLKQDKSGMFFRHGLLYRRPIGWEGALSYEVGVQYNTSRAEKGKTYLLARLVMPVWRRWIEFEARPKALMAWDGSRTVYTFFLNINVFFEDFLRSDKE